LFSKGGHETGWIRVRRRMPAGEIRRKDMRRRDLSCRPYPTSHACNRLVSLEPPRFAAMFAVLFRDRLRNPVYVGNWNRSACSIIQHRGRDPTVVSNEEIGGVTVRGCIRSFSPVTCNSLMIPLLSRLRTHRSPAALECCLKQRCSCAIAGVSGFPFPFDELS